MAAHAPLAPSASARWIACPGSVRLCAGVPDIESEHAALGTFAHEIAATCLKSGRDAASCIGDTDLVHTCDAEMAAHIQTYLDVVRPFAGYPDAVLGVEQRVEINDDIWGTADALVYQPERETEPGRLHVFDFKYGAGVFVPVENNAQLGCYALGALLQFSDRWQDISEVHIHIVQPRHHLGGHHHQAVAVEAIETWGALALEPAAVATRAPDAPLAAGDHCRFCDAKPSCPQLRKEALDTAAHLFDHPDGDDRVYVADEKTGIVKAAAAPPAPSELTPDQIAAAISMFPTIEQWMKAVREHAYSLANSGTVVPGHKLVDKQGNRKWRDEGDARAALELFDVDPNAAPKLVSPAAAEKLLGKADGKSLVNLLAFKPTTGTTLVPDSDTRPALNAGDVFTDLPSPEGA